MTPPMPSDPTNVLTPRQLSAKEIDAMTAANPTVCMPDTVAVWKRWFDDNHNGPGFKLAQSHDALYLKCSQLQQSHTHLIAWLEEQIASDTTNKLERWTYERVLARLTPTPPTGSEPT